MNLKNRLKKLETEVLDTSTICACHPRFVETYIQDLSADAAHNDPVLTTEPVPDICPVCGKQPQKDSITIQLVDETTARFE